MYVQWDGVHRKTALVGGNKSDLSNFWGLHIRMKVNEIHNSSLERNSWLDYY